MKKAGSTGKTGGLVYSTEHGRMCSSCGRPHAECICRQKEIHSGQDGFVRVGRQTKGRVGKGVTLITGVMMDQDGLKKLARQLKRRCGSGGTIKDGVIEIQGDHREVLIDELRRQGWKVKGMGG